MVDSVQKGEKYTKRNGKKKMTIEVAKNSFVHRLVMDVMHRIVTGATYDLKYQMRKEEAVEVKKVESTKAEPKKAKASESRKVSSSETITLPRPARKKAKADADKVSTPENAKPEDVAIA